MTLARSSLLACVGVLNLFSLALGDGGSALRAQSAPVPEMWQAEFGIAGVAGTRVVGPTLGSAYVSTTARGHIAFRVPDTDAAKHRATGFYYHYSDGRTGDVYQRAGELALGLNVYGQAGEAKVTGLLKSVTVNVQVQLSELPGCPARSVGTLGLFDSGSSDLIILTVCGRTISYKLGEPGQLPAASVVVSIRPLVLGPQGQNPCAGLTVTDVRRGGLNTLECRAKCMPIGGPTPSDDELQACIDGRQPYPSTFPRI